MTKARNIADLGSNDVLETTATGIDVTGNLTVDTNTLYVDSANNSVGVGTTSPSGKLDVNTGAMSGSVFIGNKSGTANGNNTAQYQQGTSLAFVADTNPRYSENAINTVASIKAEYDKTGADTTSGSTALTFSTYDGWALSGTLSEKMRIDSSGNLLVGVTSPQDFTSTTTNGHTLYGGSTNAALHSRNSAAALVVQRTVSDGNLVDLFKDTTKVGSIGSYLGEYPYLISSTNKGLVFGASDVNPCGAAGVASDAEITLGSATRRFKDLYLSGGLRGDTLTFSSTAGAERMRITSAGNVGIGTATPNAYANLTALTLDGTSGSVVDFEVGGVLKGELYTSTAALTMSAYGTHHIAFTTTDSGTERMRVDAAGLVGIGETSPNARLVVKEAYNSGVSALKISDNTTTSNQSIPPIDFSHDGDRVRARLQAVNTGAYGAKGFAFSSYSPTSWSDTADKLQERVRIDHYGNVGIGTSSPDSLGQRLVVGDGAGNEGISIYTGNTSEGSINFADGTSGVDTYVGKIGYNHSTNQMTFVTAASTRVLIDSAGKLKIGVPTSNTQSYLTITKQGDSSAIADSPSIVLSNREQPSTGTDGAIGGGIFFNGFRDVRAGAINAGIWFTRNDYGTVATNSDIVFGAAELYGEDDALPQERMRITNSGTILGKYFTNTFDGGLPAPRVIDVNTFTYHDGSTYYNRDARIAKFTPGSGEFFMRGRILHTGDLNYSYMHADIEFEIHQWGSTATYVNACVKANPFNQRTSYIGFDSDGTIWFRNNDQWSQHGQLIIYEATGNVDLNASNHARSATTGVTWYPVSNSETVQIETLWSSM